jgi:hypothetical protein
MSGTIPSMETTHEELKDNTIIIGNILVSLFWRVTADLLRKSLRCFW